MEVRDLVEKIISQLFVPVEASGRHVHVTKEQALQLFGQPLTPARPLSQPGQYLANQRVCIRGPKGEFSRVAVLGPERKEAQVEISLTDGKTLGITPPVRLSGDTKNTPGITLVGEKGTVELSSGVMAAQRHIHLDPASAEKFSVTDGQIVRLGVKSSRPVIFEDVVVRVHESFAPAVHLDYDEANGCGLGPGELGRILPCERS